MIINITKKEIDIDLLKSHILDLEHTPNYLVMNSETKDILYEQLYYTVGGGSSTIYKFTKTYDSGNTREFKIPIAIDNKLEFGEIHVL